MRKLKEKIIGTTFSCWDLLHSGHNIFLEDLDIENIKKLSDKIICNITSVLLSLP